MISLLTLGCERPASPAPAGDRGRAFRKSGRIRVLVIASTDIRDIPLGLAVEDLNAQGYGVHVTSMLGGALMTEALARGDAELGSFNNETVWTAIAKGVRARTLMQRLSFPNLLVAKRELTDCGALDGKPVAIGSQTGLNPRLVALYLDRTCARAAPQLLVIQDSVARTAALTAGRVDAALLPLEELLKLQQAAPDRYSMLVDLTKEFPLLQVTGVHARSDWLEQNPQAARDVIRALLLAHRRVIANPETLYTKVIEQLKLDPSTAKILVDASLAAGAWDPNGALTRENVQYTLNFLQAMSAVPRTLRFEDVADLSYLDAVLAEIGRK